MDCGVHNVVGDTKTWVTNLMGLIDFHLCDVRVHSEK